MANGHHIAVEVHGGLGHAGGARGEAQQAGVVARRVHVVEVGRGALHGRFQAVRPFVVEVAQVAQQGRFQRRQAHLFGQRGVAQRVADLANVDDGLQLFGAQQRHGGHGDAAGLHHRKPASREHGVVGRAQQHAVAGHQAHVLHQHVGDAVRLVAQVGVGPGQTGRADADAVAMAARNVLVQQFGGAVEALGELQFGQIEHEFRLLIGGRQVVAGKGVNVGGGHGVCLPGWVFSGRLL